MFSSPLFVILAALAAGFALMPLPIYQICSRGCGTEVLAHYGAADILGAASLGFAALWYIGRSYLQRLRSDERGFAAISRKTPPEIVYSGSQITLPGDPTKMPLKTAIEWLQKLQIEEDTQINVTETIDVYPWDGARALMLAIKERYGFAASAGMFPRQISVAVDLGEVESVAWGSFEVPGITGRLSTSSTYNPAGQLVFQLSANVPKKFAPAISELAQLTREILKTRSIYRGKAIRFAVDNDGDVKIPEFIDLSRVDPRELVFTTDITDQIDVTMYAPLRRREWCKALGIPFKRGICLLGQYGTGKTLAIYVAAQMARANGITFILCEDPSELPRAMLLARQYAPSVLACEDIDRVTRERDDLCNDIMDSLDGVESKDCDVMTLFTSNHPDDIHPAMRRPGRIDTFIRVLPPDRFAVDRLLRMYSRGLLGADENLSEPCRLLDGQIPAVIREVVERAKLAAVARADSLSEARELTSADITIAAKRLTMQLQLFAAKPVLDTSLRSAVAQLGAALAVHPQDRAQLARQQANGGAARHAD